MDVAKSILITREHDVAVSAALLKSYPYSYSYSISLIP